MFNFHCFLVDFYHLEPKCGGAAELFRSHVPFGAWLRFVCEMRKQTTACRRAALPLLLRRRRGDAGVD